MVSNNIIHWADHHALFLPEGTNLGLEQVLHSAHVESQAGCPAGHMLLPYYIDAAGEAPQMVILMGTTDFLHTPLACMLH